jgi:3-phosphoshikimate 1-carboxyvinyltransferase
LSNQTINPPSRLAGAFDLPGDKSISHRAAIFNAIAEGSATIDNFLTGADCLATVRLLQALGVDIVLAQGEGLARLTVHGVGLYGLTEPTDVLDATNSGTTMRLLAGLLAGQSFFSVLTGDASLRRRPMARVVEPLSLMGARIMARGNGQFAPLAMRGARPLHAINYALPVASAQVKSALILAALYARGSTLLRGKVGSRDHTERLLRAMGVPLDIAIEPGSDEGLISIIGGVQPKARSLAVPGDISTAAFWMVAGVAHPNAELTLRGVGLNPTRRGIIDALQEMGGNLVIRNQREQAGEPVADITVRSSELRGIEVGGAMIPTMIDELPILAVAAACAEGRTVIRDAAEIRAKETDRIATVADGLNRMGIAVEQRPDGMTITGGKLRGATIGSHTDHRIAMTFAIAALLATGPTTIEGAEAVSVSYPTFWEQLRRVISEE